MIIETYVNKDNIKFLIEKIRDVIGVSKNSFLYRISMDGKPVMITEDLEIAREFALGF